MKSRENLQLPLQIQISKKRKPFTRLLNVWIFTAFLETIWKAFLNKDDPPHSLGFSEIIDF